MSRTGGLLRAVALVALATAVAGEATAAKKPAKTSPETSRRCRSVLARDVLNLTSVGLRNISSCQRQSDHGRPPRSDCNGLENLTTSAYGRAEELTRRQVGDLLICPPGDPALANYPGGSSQGLIEALLPAVERTLESSGDVSLAGIPQGLGRGAGARRIGKCRRAIAAAHGAIVRQVLKASLRCQRRIDKRSTSFGEIAPECLGGANATGRKMAARADRACLGVSAAQAATCVLLPNCLLDSAVTTAHALARFTFPGDQECGNGVVELGEQCDDGNLEPDDRCTPTCRLPGGPSESFCGNGKVEGSEQCDEGASENKDDGNCTKNCRFAVCGDGLIDVTEPGIEQCDDGNLTPDDGCTNCEIDGKVCVDNGIVANVSFLYEPRITGALGGAWIEVPYSPPLSLPGSGTDRSVRDRFTLITTQPGVTSRFVDCDAGTCLPNEYTGLNTVRARLLLTDSSGAQPAQLPTGRIGSIRFDCPDGTIVRIRDLPCFLDQVSDGNDTFPLKRLQDEKIRCIVDSLEGGAVTTTTTTTTTSTTRRPTTTTSTTTTTTLVITCDNDGVKDDLQFEECDDGNTIAEDDCDNCRINVCGDGVPDRQGPVTEECDDGNRNDADGCTNSCTICGNRTITPPETCDDGNLANEDFCPGDCRTDFCQPGTNLLPVTVRITNPNVAALTMLIDYPEGKVDLQGLGGDIPPGIVVGPGTATTQGFDFDHALRIVAFDVFNFGTTEAATVTFNRCVRSPYPTADEFSCRLEGQASDENFEPVPGVECFVEVPPPVNLCGDGVVDPGEACDDGNASNEDDCLTTCTRNTCGDGFRDQQGPVVEECDDRNTNPNDGCTDKCTVCGNRTITPPEGCDDGNLVAEDFCPSDCRLEFCQPTLQEYTATIQLNTPDVAALTVFVDYPEGQVNLQGVGGDIPAGILTGPGTATTQGFDFEHALRVVAFDVFNFGTTTMATVKFNGCQGGAPPSPADFGCRLEGNATDENFAVVPGVTCTVNVQ